MFLAHRNLIAKSLSRGQALVEYLLVAAFMSVIIWYALIGGSIDNNGRGGLYETDDEYLATGNYLDAQHPGSEPAPGLVQALHGKQERFIESIYQP